MKPATYLPLLGALAANASPLNARQAINFDLLDSVPDPTVVTLDVLAPATTVAFDLAAATEEALSQPLSEKRSINKRAACDPQDEGHGPAPEDDTPEAFVDFEEFGTTAEAAGVPSGYKQTFSNLQGSSAAYAYMGHTLLEEYDPSICAAECDNKVGCSGLNIFFERAPSVEPGTGCRDPPSTTYIKCVYWGGPVFEGGAHHKGQWRDDFHVVIAGSNGYMKDSVKEINGYTGIALGDASINAPLNCNDEDTYLGVKLFTTGYFDPSLCAAACSNIEGDRECRFFTTYVAHLAGRPEGQYCAMYSQSWDKSWATNKGQYRGDDFFSVNYAFAYWNNANPGFPENPEKK